MLYVLEKKSPTRVYVQRSDSLLRKILMQWDTDNKCIFLHYLDTAYNNNNINPCN